MPDRTILMLLTTLILIAFRYYRNNIGEPYNKKYDGDFLPEVERWVPTQLRARLFNDATLEKSSQLIEKYPMDAGAYGDRGAIYIKLKRYDEALNDLNKAVDLQPSYADALNNRGVTYYYLGLFEQAVNDFTTALSHVSDDGMYYLNRGMAYKKIGDHLKAGADFDRALELDRQALKITYKGAVKHRPASSEQPRVVFFQLDILYVKYQRVAYEVMNN